MENDPPPPYSEISNYRLPVDSARRLTAIIGESSSNTLENPIESIVVKIHEQIPALNNLANNLNENVIKLEKKRIYLFKQIFEWRRQFQSWIDECFNEITTTIKTKFDAFKQSIDEERKKLAELTESIIKSSETAIQIAVGGRFTEIQEVHEKLLSKERQVRSALSNPIDKSFSKLYFNPSTITFEDCKKLVGNLKWEMNVSNQDNLQNQEQQEQQSLPSNSIESDNSPERIDETDENMARSVHSFTRNTPTRKDFKKFYFSRSFSTKTYKDKARCNALSFTFNDMDQIVVPDKNNKKIKVFTAEGQLVQELTHNKLRSPTDVLVLPSNDTVVSDPECGDAKVFSPTNQLLASLRPCDKPCGLSLVKSGSHLIVSCILSNAVHLVDLRVADHSVAKIRTGFDNAPLFLYPHYVSTDRNNSLFVSDRISNCVCHLDLRKITGNGQCSILKKYGGSGSGVGKFNDPYGCFALEGGGFLVCDYYNHRIQAACDTFFTPPLTQDDHIDFPTCIKVTNSGKVYVSEYMTGSIKAWVDTPTLTDDRPPAYENKAELYSPRTLSSDMNDNPGQTLMLQTNWSDSLI